VRAHRYRAYAGEPDEPQFTEIVEGLSRWLGAFRTEHPDLAQVDEAYETATLAALTRIWHTPADVNGALSDELLLARRHYQDRVAGPEIAEAWRRWHDHAVTMVRRAARENPGQRILVLLGVDNCARLRPALRGLPELRLVEMEVWLRQPSSP